MSEHAGFVSPKIELRLLPEKGGRALFACAPIPKEEILIVWSGRVVTDAELAYLGPAEQGHSVQIEEGLYQAPLGMDDPADCINHSCDPNAGLRGQIVVVAMRAIHPGEEITLDYAMVDGSSYDEFECACGAANCRGRVSGDDWQRPELWQRYDGYFSSYLQRRIARRKMEVAGHHQKKSAG